MVPDKIYQAFAVSRDYDGPLAAEFHAMVERKFADGMISGHCSVGPSATPETLVREHLAIEWAVSHGHAFRTRHFLPEIPWHDLRLSVLRERWGVFMASVRSKLCRNPYRV